MSAQKPALGNLVNPEWITAVESNSSELSTTFLVIFINSKLEALIFRKVKGHKTQALRLPFCAHAA